MTKTEVIILRLTPEAKKEFKQFLNRNNRHIDPEQRLTLTNVLEGYILSLGLMNFEFKGKIVDQEKWYKSFHKAYIKYLKKLEE